MNRANLKVKWGHYCDTDRLVKTTMNLLTKYNYRNSEHGVCKMLDTYFTNKQSLIDLFRTSEHYIGDMRIVLDVELERDNVPNHVSNFCYRFMDNVGARAHIVKKVDEAGKTQADYLNTGITKLTPKDFMKESILNQLTASNENVSKFNNNGELNTSVRRFTEVRDIVQSNFAYNHQGTVSDTLIAAASALSEKVKLAKGMKTSRAFNKMCAVYGIDKLPKYNKLFAEYADMVSGLKRKMKFFLSLNPLDYLTMSFGVNWSSCHSIKTHGGWCSGTLSYMLDNTSIITYVHNEIPTDIEEGKIYREMFHLENGKLIQSRIYPQGNDGATDLYQTFREFVQKELASLLGVANSWVRKSNRCSENIESIGTHYRDYNNNSSCNATYLKSMEAQAKNAIVTVGHNRICPYCGEEITDSNYTGRLTHSNCILRSEYSTTTSHTTTYSF